MYADYVSLLLLCEYKDLLEIIVHGSWFRTSEDILSIVSAGHCSTAFFRHALGNLLSADGRHPLDDHTRFFRLEVEKAVTSTSMS